MCPGADMFEDDSCAKDAQRYEESLKEQARTAERAAVVAHLQRRVALIEVQIQKTSNLDSLAMFLGIRAVINTDIAEIERGEHLTKRGDVSAAAKAIAAECRYCDVCSKCMPCGYCGCERGEHLPKRGDGGENG